MPSAYSIYTQDPAPPVVTPTRRAAHAWARRAAAGLVIVLLLAGLVIGWRTHRENRRRRDLLALLQKEQNMAKLRDAVRSGQITRQDARQVFASRARQRLEEYFKLPPGPKRTSYLDKQIDTFQARRAQIDARRQQFALARASSGPAPTAQTPPASRAARMESIPPENRAQMQQFRYDMRQRMQQRNIAPPALGR